MTTAGPARDLADLGRAEVSLVSLVARNVARRFGHHRDTTELESLGMLVACDAARNHDPARGDFGPYLAGRLHWAMMSDARKSARRERLLGVRPRGGPGDDEPARPDEELEVAIDATTPEHLAEREQSRHRLRRALARLDDESRGILVRHYFGDESLEMVAAELGSSKAQVTRLHRHALRRLGALLGS